MNSLKQRLGKRLSRYLSEPGHTAGTAAPTRMDLLAQVLRPADVLLVEGTSRVSSAIKYLTQSWLVQPFNRRFAPAVEQAAFFLSKNKMALLPLFLSKLKIT